MDLNEIMFSEIRDIDPAGRVVIPSGARKFLELNPGDKVQVFVEKGTVIVRKLSEVCVFCNSSIEGQEDVLRYNNKLICANCRSKIASLKCV